MRLLPALLLAALAACQNPASQGFNALSVIQTNPHDGGQNVDPGQPITIQFNKALDYDWLQQNAPAVTISPASAPVSSLTFDFDGATNTLTVNVHPYLASNCTYTVTLTSNLKAASGDTLSQPVTLGFTTGSEPAGDVQINHGSRYVNDNHMLKLYLVCNDSQLKVVIADAEAGLALAALRDVAPSIEWPPSEEDGAQMVFVQFMTADKTEKSAVRSAAIIRDTKHPAVQFTLPQYDNASTASVQPVVNATDENGIAAYSWSANPSTGVAFSSPTAPTPTITLSGADGSYAISVQVTDPAGNGTDYGPVTIVKDVTAPGKPDDKASGWGSTAGQQTTLRPTWVMPKPSTIVNPPGEGPDVYILQLDNQTPFQLPLPQMRATYISPSDLGDNSTHTLTIWQQDAAGNQSPPLPIPVTVSPVIPLDGSTLLMGGLSLKWRDFDSSHTYTVYLAQVGSGFVDSGVLPQGTTVWTPSTWSPVKYQWYVVAASRARMPPGSNTYYSFDVSKN